MVGLIVAAGTARNRPAQSAYSGNDIRDHPCRFDFDRGGLRLDELGALMTPKRPRDSNQLARSELTGPTVR
jgi:hypothetical protein